jgi:SSS family solute:Na+ symporter
MNWLDLLVVFLFILSILCVGIRKVSRTESSYLVADRQTGFFALTATLAMTEFNTATLVAFSSLGYLAGLWGLILPVIFLIGLLFYAVTVAKKWKSFNGLSVAAFFGQRYGKDIGKFASITLLISTTCFSSAYIKSLVVIFHPFFPDFSEWIVSGIIVFIAFLLSMRGGLLSVIYTDIVSFIVTFAFFPIMAFFSWNASEITIPSWDSFQAGSAQVPFWYVSSLTVLTMFTYILAPWCGQKIFAAKTERIAHSSMIASAILVFFLYELAVLSAACLNLSGVSLANSEHALCFILNRFLPNGLRGLGYSVFFAASATTLIGVWSAMTSMVIGDFFKTESSKKSTRSILITLCITALSYLLSNVFIDRILDKIILANIPIAALSFALLAGFYWKKASRGGAYSSIIVGLACGIGSYVYFGEKGGYTWYWSMIGIPLTFLSGILGSYLAPASTQTHKLSMEKNLETY